MSKKLTKVFHGESLPIDMINETDFYVDVTSVPRKYNKQFYNWFEKLSVQEEIKHLHNQNKIEIVLIIGTTRKIHSGLTKSFFEWLVSTDSKRKQKDIIYVISDGRFHKIGMTTNSIRAKLRGLQVGNPLKLECIFYLKTEHANAIERATHKYFKDDRLVGEWFDASPEQIEKKIVELNISYNATNK
jgi:hypothetical protein